MCRFAWYEGPPVPLAALLYDPPHSLEEQAVAPREMQSARINVDGTGVAWWPPGEAVPLRYRTTRPPWSDVNLPDLARRLVGDRIMAQVRSATPGIPVGAAQVAPFVAEGLVVTHNGWVRGYRERVADALLRQVPPEVLPHMDAVSDSATVFLLLLAERRAAPGAALLDVVRATIERVEATCRALGEAATLNLLVSDGVTAVATRRALAHPADSLHVASGTARLPAAVVVASEALDDDPAWEPVPPDSALVVHRGTVVRHAL